MLLSRVPTSEIYAEHAESAIIQVLQSGNIGITEIENGKQ